MKMCFQGLVQSSNVWKSIPLCSVLGKVEWRRCVKAWKIPSRGGLNWSTVTLEYVFYSRRTPTITQEKEIKKQKSSTPIKIFNEKARVNTISDTIHLPDFFNDWDWSRNGFWCSCRRSSKQCGTKQLMIIHIYPGFLLKLGMLQPFWCYFLKLVILVCRRVLLNRYSKSWSLKILKRHALGTFFFLHRI